MNEEEKKALETIKEELQDQKQAFKYYKGVLGVYSNGKVEILLKLIDKQQKEIEEKTTIIMAGAEKVKQLEKEIQRLEKDNDTLSKLVIVNEDKVIKELDLISKDKIREKINKLKANDIEYSEHIAILEKLLEE